MRFHRRGRLGIRRRGTARYGRNGIVPSPRQGMAPQDTIQSVASTLEHAVPGNSLHRILRACRDKTAGRRQQGRNTVLIQANGQDGDKPEQLDHSRTFGNTRRKRQKPSLQRASAGSNGVNSCPAMESVRTAGFNVRLGTTTISHPCGRCAWFCLKNSRITRLTRLRTTAQPVLRVTASPRRHRPSSFRLRTNSTNCFV